jgi:hypothetical protein
MMAMAMIPAAMPIPAVVRPVMIVIAASDVHVEADSGGACRTGPTHQAQYQSRSYKQFLHFLSSRGEGLAPSHRTGVRTFVHHRRTHFLNVAHANAFRVVVLFARQSASRHGCSLSILEI